MSVQEDAKKQAGDEGRKEDSTSVAPEGGEVESAADERLATRASEPPADDSGLDEVAPVGSASPAQLGARRFVYAAYFAGAMGIAFLVSKLAAFGWLKLQSYSPSVGEPRDEIIMPVAGLIGVLAALYYWYRTRARQLAEEVAAEMSKVTWPTRTEVTNGTVVVIVTTIVSTVFFALMDKFWGFVTNLVYGGT
ncbi:MAG: preprotein translocase subunit SecE [Polyangiaceae bacterium]|jgi:preprotein translocase subunit SecE